MAIIFKRSAQFGRFIAHMKIQSVPKNKNRPDGFKANFVLINIDSSELILLVDNHDPFGYHLHPSPEKDKSIREPLDVNSPYEAMTIFLNKVRHIVNEK